MNVVYEYSHFGGSEILQVRHPQFEQEIYEIISRVQGSKKLSGEQKSPHAQSIRPAGDICENFNQFGYQELSDAYTIATLEASEDRRGGYRQIDFVKDKVLIEVQFGKYAFMFYDMAKFQYFFNENKADIGVEIVPCHALQRQMSSGVSDGEQLVYDIERLKRHFPAVPIKIILVDADEDE